MGKDESQVTENDITFFKLQIANEITAKNMQTNFLTCFFPV